MAKHHLYHEILGEIQKRTTIAARHEVTVALMNEMPDAAIQRALEAARRGPVSPLNTDMRSAKFARRKAARRNRSNKMELIAGPGLGRPVAD